VFFIFALIWSLAAVGAYYRLKSHTLDADTKTWHYNVGFALAITAIVFNVAGLLGGICMDSKSDEYGVLA